MSRRAFLEGMRRKVRSWELSDADSPRSCSGSDHINTGGASGETTATELTQQADDDASCSAPQATTSSSEADKTAAFSAMDSTNARVTPSTMTSTAATHEAPLPGNPLLNTHTTEYTVVSATTVVLSRTSSPPPQTPPAVEVDDADPPRGSLWQLPRKVNGHTKKALSPEALAAAGHQEKSADAETPGSSMPQRVSVSHSQQPQRRSNHSMSAVPDVLVTPRTSNHRRLSNPRGSTVLSSRSVGAMTPVVAARRSSFPGGSGSGRNTAAAAAAVAQNHNRDRSSSINRMEASLIALQVELATEKRHNIEAEQHIMTLNEDVQRLRVENARLSREAAEATVATTAANSEKGSTRIMSTGTAAAAPALDSGAMVSATRIEALEARIGELLRSLETKQRELDAKSERIRLLEHKLADQLLLQTNVHYINVPTAAAQPPLPAHQVPQSPYHHSSTSNLSAHSCSSATAAGLPSHRLWQAEAPDTTLAGPKISAIRQVALTGMSHLHEISSTNSVRTSSAVRRRSPAGYQPKGQSDELHQLSLVPPINGAGEDCTHIVPRPAAASAPTSPAQVKTAERTDRKISTRSPSAQRELPLRPQSTRRRQSSSSHGSTSTMPLEWRRVSRTDSMCRRPDSTSSEPHRAAAPAGAAKPRESGSLPSGRLGARRPSLKRCESAYSPHSAPEPEGLQRKDSRRGSNAMHHTPCRGSTAACTGHPAHVNMTGSAATNSASSVYSVNGRALSTYRPTRQPSATRSVAQQSVRSGTSTRPRPQIAFASDGETSTMKGTTATVMFPTRDWRVGSSAMGRDSNHSSTTADLRLAVAAAAGASEFAARPATAPA
ncbi:hypothetical protein ABL78_1803 [Leptomonas seymouri]|uniref:Uncharacterized protein n=1 Tax=Leptomonas seymouri TaxID=5684 RepID=A0A0N0P840_LEPSE|nr:hypothetical protein ABL78_1803 [Leptomonas seymouri]|eukprot:KPI89067.1 hypothetical protein ABL78_1803 [Leptomonas seymouri]